MVSLSRSTEGLEEKLSRYAEADFYPFHMPGHKRLPEGENPYRLDITEIEGFDDLHDAQGIIREAQERAARLYGADQTYFLVNGSTCGILAAVCAAVPRRGRVLMARDCHKSVYHALQLQEAKAVYLTPSRTQLGPVGSISPAQVSAALWQGQEEGRPFDAVVVTSPTYDGVVSDVASIADAAHAAGIPLIADAAHGAHFGFASGFPQNPLRLGADAVIAGAHKSLPSLTQTALLHLRGGRIAPERVRRYLDIFETSSPSYVLMASLDRCIRLMEEEGEERLSALREKLDAFYENLCGPGGLRHLLVLRKHDFAPGEVFDFDESKILIHTKRAEMSGYRLAECLRCRYGIETEAAYPDYVLALSSLMDTEEGFSRLTDALRALDMQAEEQKKARPAQDFAPVAEQKEAETAQEQLPGAEQVQEFIAEDNPQSVCGIAQAADAPQERILLSDAPGSISASFLVPYPPGIPAVVPGERITRQTADELSALQRRGIRIEGLFADGTILIVKPGQI